MKIILAPFGFAPDPIGGTEIYVQSLGHCLQRAGCQVLIAAPGDQPASYDHKGLPVRRFSVPEKVYDLAELYGEGNEEAATQFARILEEGKPDLVHLHAFTRGASLRLVREAKRRHIPVVFTYHTPTASCQRGTLLHWGEKVCDGQLDLSACTSCTLHGHGVPKILAQAVGRMPMAVGRFLANGHSSGVWTALRMRELVQLRHTAFHDLMAEVDHVVAVCEWVKDLLVRNRVLPSKITLSRQGLPGEDSPAMPRKARSENGDGALKIAFLGRLDPTKGVHVLIDAIRRLPKLPVHFDVFGVSQGTAGEVYGRQLQRMANGDQRIAFCPPIPVGQVVHRLAGYDLVTVPSQWLETGPLVVLEAFAAGVPVLGSRLGGIAELVDDGINGILLQHDSTEVWGRQLTRLAKDRDIVERLRGGIRPPRMMATVAAEMASLYRTLLENDERPPR